MLPKIQYSPNIEEVEKINHDFTEERRSGLFFEVPEKALWTAIDNKFYEEWERKHGKFLMKFLEGKKIRPSLFYRLKKKYMPILSIIAIEGLKKISYFIQWLIGYFRGSGITFEQYRFIKRAEGVPHPHPSQTFPF